MIDALLAYQGDTATPWTANVGTTIETYRTAGRVTDAQWTRYAKQAWLGSFTFRVRSKVRLGDPFPLEQAAGHLARAASSSILRVTLFPAIFHFQPGELQTDSMELDARLGGIYGGIMTSTIKLPDGLTVGPQSARLDAVVQIVEDRNRTKTVATDKFSRAFPFEILPADRQSVRMIHDPSLADKIRQSITWKSLLLPKSIGRWSNDDSTQLMVQDCPVDLSFEVFVFNAAGKKIRVGSFALPAGRGAFSWGFCLPTDETFGPTSDVILQGGPAAAAETIDRVAGWDGTIVLKDLPIVLSK